MKKETAVDAYHEQILNESRKWGNHLKVEASGEWHAWLDHPLVAEHYHKRSLIAGLTWEQWVSKHFGRPAQKSLDLGCGSGGKSISVFQQGGSSYVEGADVSEDRIGEAERHREELGIPGKFWAADVNQIKLPPNTYDLIFSSHSFHHFLELEHIMEQVRQALTPGGLFILEEFVGPTQFQWTDQQMALVQSLMSLVPERLRMFRWGAVKTSEGRPTPAEVVAVSPFESIRSADILPLFEDYFRVVNYRRMGGTIQHLFYNGIIHNFRPDDAEAVLCQRGIFMVEDTLMDAEMLPSDFMLLVGQREG